MNTLYMYFGVCVGTLIIGFRVMAWVGEYIFSPEKKNSFDSTLSGEEMPPFSPEPRDYELLGDDDFNIVNLVFRKIPTVITVWSLGILISMLVGSWVSTKNIERLAASGAALEAGNTGLALSHLWPVGKDIAKDQYRVISGSHPVLRRYGLEYFKYMGVHGDYDYAIMPDLVTANDIDNSIKPEDDDYDTIIYGSEAENAMSICESLSDDVEVTLINSKDWELSLSHIIANRNINRETGIAEWFSDQNSNDNDNYMLNLKDNPTLIAKTIDDEEFHASEDGVYFDEDDIHDHLQVGFRCIAKWPKGENTTEE